MQALLNTSAVVESYKALGNVKHAFRNLKTVQLKMRPVYHKTDDRIRAHIFLCTLGYYVQPQCLRYSRMVTPNVFLNRCLR